MTSRVLILDDEVLIALDLAMILEEDGFEICGPHYKLDAALNAISKNPPDAAILDVNLGNNVTSVPAAEALDDQSIPFAFLTGYEKIETQLEPRFRGRPRLGKPFDRKRITAVVTEMLAS